MARPKYPKPKRKFRYEFQQLKDNWFFERMGPTGKLFRKMPDSKEWRFSYLQDKWLPRGEALFIKRDNR